MRQKSFYVVKYSSSHLDAPNARYLNALNANMATPEHTADAVLDASSAQAITSLPTVLGELDSTMLNACFARVTTRQIIRVAKFTRNSG